MSDTYRIEGPDTYIFPLDLEIAFTAVNYDEAQKKFWSIRKRLIQLADEFELFCDDSESRAYIACEG